MSPHTCDASGWEKVLKRAGGVFVSLPGSCCAFRAKCAHVSRIFSFITGYRS